MDTTTSKVITTPSGSAASGKRDGTTSQKRGEVPPGKILVVPPPRVAVKTAALQTLEATAAQAPPAAELLIPGADCSGSLEQFNLDWNAADTSEVSSSDPNARHPAGPGKIAQSLHSLQCAVLQMTRDAEVRLLIIPPTSPRDSCGVIETRPSEDYSAGIFLELS